VQVLPKAGNQHTGLKRITFNHINNKAMPTQITGITFYTVQETAKELRVSTQSVRNYIKQGKLKARRVGKFIMITEIDIRKFLNL